LHYSNTRQTGGKRRSDYNSDLVANVDPMQRDRKYSCQDGRGGNAPRPAAKKFSAADLLDEPCTYHSREASQPTTQQPSASLSGRWRKHDTPRPGTASTPPKSATSTPATLVAMRAPSTSSQGRQPMREEGARPHHCHARSRRQRAQVSQLVRAGHHAEQEGPPGKAGVPRASRPDRQAQGRRLLAPQDVDGWR
jgi:hypothetical protein